MFNLVDNSISTPRSLHFGNNPEPVRGDFTYDRQIAKVQDCCQLELSIDVYKKFSPLGKTQENIFGG